MVISHHSTVLNLLQVQPLEVMPFIEEILNNIRAIICDLQPHQVHTFYEAVGYMIQAQVVSMMHLHHQDTNLLYFLVCTLKLHVDFLCVCVFFLFQLLEGESLIARI